MFYKYRWFLLFLYLVFGLYFLNYPFGFVKIPSFISAADSWIFLVAGILIVLGGISYFKTTRYIRLGKK